MGKYIKEPYIYTFYFNKKTYSNYKLQFCQNHAVSFNFMFKLTITIYGEGHLKHDSFLEIKDIMHFKTMKSTS